MSDTTEAAETNRLTAPREAGTELTTRNDWWTPTGLDQALAFAERMAKSDMVPARFRGKPDEIVASWSLGAPLGLSMLASLRYITVINGTPSIWGDGALAVALAHPLCEYVHETLEVTGDYMVATCATKRRGSPFEVVRTFSTDDARRAKLWGDTRRDPWLKYPKRMLQMRARGFALRDAFADALCGMPLAEEIRDITDEVEVRDTEPPKPPPARKSDALRESLQREAEAPTDADVSQEVPDAEPTVSDDRATLDLELSNAIERLIGTQTPGGKALEDLDQATAFIEREVRWAFGCPYAELSDQTAAEVLEHVQSGVRLANVGLTNRAQVAKEITRIAVDSGMGTDALVDLAAENDVPYNGGDMTKLKSEELSKLLDAVRAHAEMVGGG